MLKSLPNIKLSMLKPLPNTFWNQIFFIIFKEFSKVIQFIDIINSVLGQIPIYFFNIPISSYKGIFSFEVWLERVQ